MPNRKPGKNASSSWGDPSGSSWDQEDWGKEDKDWDDQKWDKGSTSSKRTRGCRGGAKKKLFRGW